MNTPETSSATTVQESQDRVALLQTIQSFPKDPLVAVENIIRYNASHLGTPIILGGTGKEAEFVRNYGRVLNKLLETPENKEKCQQLAIAFRGILSRSAAVIFSAWYNIK